MRLTSLGVVRGLIGYFTGMLIGMAVVVISRLVLGMSAWDQEAVWVGGIVFSIIGFLLGVGAMSDWFQWWTRGSNADSASSWPARGSTGLGALF